MRIGFFTDNYLPATDGVVISIEAFRKNLEKMGHEVYIYAPESPGYKDKSPRVFRFKSQKFIKDPEMRFAFNFLPVGHKFKNITRFKLDVVHAQTPFGMGLLAKYISNNQLIPLIYTHHTHYPEYVKFYLKEELLLPYLAKIYSSWFSNISDAIIAPSVKIKNLLRNYGVKNKVPIYILPSGIDLKIFKKSLKNRKKLRKKLKIPAEKKVLISIGRMGKEKNVEFLLKSFAEILKEKKDVLLLLVGDGPYLQEFKDISDKLGISHSVIFIGKIPHKEIISYYQAGDVFIFSSLTDTQGIVILEALACGLPVVALKDEALTDIVLNNKNGFLVKNQSTKVFAEKIIKVLDDKVVYKKFSQKAIAIAKKFSEENVAKKLSEIYKRHLKKKYKMRS